MAKLQTGTVVGERFELIGELGRGGTAVVWLARDRRRQADVALKVLHGHLADDPGTTSQLEREVAAATRIRHPGALVPYDLHVHGDVIALSLPLHRGLTLADHVATHGPWTADALERLLRRLLDVLGEAHRQGVVHRDVTPGNVLVDADGTAVLTDFGLARVDGRHSMTRTTAWGTPGYAAPELHHGLPIDGRADLYGAGAVVYLAATGGAPFAATSAAASLKRQLDGSHVPLREARPDLPPLLTHAVDALLAPNPAHRPQSALGAIEHLERGAKRTAKPTVGPRAHHLPAGRHTVVVTRRHGQRRRRGPHGWVLVRLARRAALSASQMIRDAGDHDLAHRIAGFAGISPERRLSIAVARAACLPDDALAVPQAMRVRRFRLVAGVEEAVADELALAAGRAGFSSRVITPDPSRPPRFRTRQVSVAVGLVGLLSFLALAPRMQGPVGPLLLGGMIAGIVLVVHSFAATGQGPDRSPLAFGTDLRPLLRRPYRHLLTAPPGEPPVPEVPHIATLADRLSEQVHQLRDLVRTRDLPSAIARDLRQSLDEIAVEGETLGADLSRTEAAWMAARPSPAHEDATQRLRARLVRLATMEKAGEIVDETETARLRAQLDKASAETARAESLDRRRIQLTARLLELEATLREVRRELLGGADPTKPLTQALVRLRENGRASRAAMAEVDKALRAAQP